MPGRQLRGFTAEKSVDTLMELSAMFAVCRRGMSKRQQRCRGGSVGRHAGETDGDVWSLSARHARTAAAGFHSGKVGRHADGTGGDVCRLSARYVKTSAAVSWRNKRGRTLVELMAMFEVCRCGIPGGSGGVVAEVLVETLVELKTTFRVCRRGIPIRQLRFRSGTVGRNADGIVDDVCHLSTRYAKTSAAVSWQKSR